jgi:hypothetical protein
MRGLSKTNFALYFLTHSVLGLLFPWYTIRVVDWLDKVSMLEIVSNPGWFQKRAESGCHTNTYVVV